MDVSTRTKKTLHQDDQRWIGNGGRPIGEPRSIVLDRSAFDLDSDFPDGFIPSGVAVGKITATGLYGPYGGNVNEVQTITVVQGSPPGGTWTYTLEGETSAGIAPGASAATAKTAIVDSMSNIGVDDIDVSKSGDVYTLTLKGRWAGVNVPAGSVTDSTTGTGHGVTIAQTTAGGSTASDGTETCAGLIFAAEPYDRDSTADIAVALFWSGEVIESFLPDNNGVDATAKAQLTHIAFV